MTDPLDAIRARHAHGREYDRSPGHVHQLFADRRDLLAALDAALARERRLREALDAADLLSKALKAWVMSGLKPDDWPRVQTIGVAYEQARAALAEPEAGS